MFDHIEENGIRLNEADQQQLIAAANDEQRLWEDQTSAMRGDDMEARQLYYANRPDNSLKSADSEGMANVRRPVLPQAMDSVQAQQVQSLFPAEERFFGYMPQNEKARMGRNNYEKSVEQRIVKNNILKGYYLDLFNTKLDNVGGAVYCPFKRITQNKTVYKKGIFPWSKPKASKQDVVVAEYTDFVPLSPFDWWVDPCVDNIEDTAFIWRQWVTKEYIEDNEYFINTDNLKTFQEQMDEKSADKEVSKQYFGINRSDEKMGEHYVCLYERWGDFRVNGKLYKNHFMVYSNNATMHYFGENPYNHGMKPFLVSPYIPVPGSLHGKSLAQDIIPLANTSDSMLNQVLDIVNVNANPWFTYLMNDTGVLQTIDTEGGIELRPGTGIPVKNHESIQVRQWDISGLNSLLPIMQSIKDEIRESTGGLSYATGGVADTDPTRTATESSLLASGASTRYQSLNQFYEDAKLKPYITMFLENDKQFMSEPILVDNEFVRPNDVKFMEFTVDILGSKSVLTRERETQRQIEFLPILEKMIQGGYIQVKQGKVAEFDMIEYAKSIMKNQKIDDDLLDEQEIETEDGLPQLGDLNAAQGIPQPQQGAEAALLAAAGGVGGMAGIDPAPQDGQIIAA